MPRRRHPHRDADFDIHEDSGREDSTAAMDHHDDEAAPLELAGREPDAAARPQHQHAGQQGAGEDGGRDEAAADGSRRGSALSSVSQLSSRRASRRTEALIHAAARDIVEHVGSRHHRLVAEEEGDEEERSEEQQQQQQQQQQQPQPPSSDGAESVVVTRAVDGEPRNAAPPDEAGDSSSHHEHDDDVFSDHSPRSSLGSMSEAEQTKIEQTLSQRNITQRVRSPPMSDMAPSDHDDVFMATVRGHARPPFRSPSSVQALQMASPPASSLGTPRSVRRTPLPTVSRLASPSIMAQYSPKKTPPRFKRATPPLVLLHVTLLPLRWAWAGVVDGAAPAGLSPEAKTLREAWRQLRDRTGDTVSDRGILLPHPQADYELLEERLLEALELPLRRRARILECGHYLGPANDMSVSREQDSDDDDDGDDDKSRADKAHWCRTCHSDIKYDSLGHGKVFRVKVYASNGLMRAGAWEACWKEMERVDVELEPIVDAALQDELAVLSAEQERAAAMEQALAEEQREASETEYGEEDDDDDDLVEGLEERDESYLEQAQDPDLEHELCSSPPRPDEAPPNSSPAPTERGRVDDEERLREIYGSSPVPRREKTAARGPSPSPEAESPRRGREPQRAAYRTASFAELVLEAARVLLQDRKNAVIALLGALLLLLAVRPAHDAAAAFQPVMAHRDARAMPVFAHDAVAGAPGGHATAAAAAAAADEPTPASSPPSQQPAAALDPCASSSLSSLDVVANRRVRDGAPDASPSTMRVFETWRVVETVTETARETLTQTETVSVSVAAVAAALETDALARWGP